MHKYFSHYNTPYDAYINYMNVVTDLEYLLEENKNEQRVIEMNGERENRNHGGKNGRSRYSTGLGLTNKDDIYQH